jgi:hypothetical protein
MRKLLLWIVTLAAFEGTALLAQTFAGTWPGFRSLRRRRNPCLRVPIQLHPKQVTGAPNWVDTQKYDLLAKPDLDGRRAPPS